MKNHLIMKNHLSASAWKRLNECSASQIAIDKGEYSFPATKPMLIGSYVDAYFSGTIDEFKQKNENVLFKKDGSLYSDFKLAEYLVQNIEKDPLFKKYMSGDVQKEVSGIIGEAEWRGKIDIYHDVAIVELKVVADLYTRVWDNYQKCYIHFTEAYGYDIQATVYQELIRQETGKNLPVFLAMITKQSPPDKAIVEVPQERMDKILSDLISDSKRILNIRNGSVDAVRCERCDYCRGTKVLTETISLYDLLH